MTDKIIEYPTLDYHGKELKLNLSNGEGFNYNIDALVDWLINREAIRVHLEPGDATRYTFLLAYVGTNLYVIRLRSYDVVGAVVLAHPSADFEYVTLVVGHEPLTPLTPSGEYTLRVCKWFLDNILLRLPE